MEKKCEERNANFRSKLKKEDVANIHQKNFPNINTRKEGKGGKIKAKIKIRIKQAHK